MPALSDILSVPLGLAVLGFAAYDDLYTLKIRNRFVVLGIAAGVCFQGALAALGLSAPRDFGMALLNGAAAFLAGTAFWHFGLWSAGDAKLFAAAALLLPPSLYHARGPWLPAFILLVNASAFVLVASLYWFVRGLVARGKHTGGLRPSTSLRTSADPAPPAAAPPSNIDHPAPSVGTSSFILHPSSFSGVLPTLVGFIVILIVGRLANEKLSALLGAANTSGTGIYVVLFILMRQVSAVFRRRAVLWPAAAAVGAYAAWVGVTQGASGLISLLNMGWISAALMVFRMLYDRLVRDLDEKSIELGELRSAMVLAPSSVAQHGIDEVVRGTDVGTLLPDGLTDAQVRDITAALGKKGMTHVAVSRTAPFAPFLLLGFLLTAWIGNTVLQIR